jgi:hypothetical protein
LLLVEPAFLRARDFNVAMISTHTTKSAYQAFLRKPLVDERYAVVVAHFNPHLMVSAPVVDVDRN